MQSSPIWNHMLRDLYRAPQPKSAFTSAHMGHHKYEMLSYFPLQRQPWCVKTGVCDCALIPVTGTLAIVFIKSEIITIIEHNCLHGPN